MSAALCFHLAGGRGGADLSASNRTALLAEAPPGGCDTYYLYEFNGLLQFRPRSQEPRANCLGDDAAAETEAPRLVAVLKCLPAPGQSQWFLLLRSPDIGLNHQTPPLGIRRLAPGDLLFIGDEFWFVTSFLRPEPGPAPVELRAQPCPVCGAGLGEAPVVRCGCGRYMHLERADAPEDPDALNCYLASPTCGSCNAPTTLDPQVMPAVPSPLCDPLQEE